MAKSLSVMRAALLRFSTVLATRQVLLGLV